MTPRFELVLPCYNEEKSLRVIAERAVRAASDAGFSPGEFKLVLVENGSRDGSRDVLDGLCAEPEIGPWIRVVHIDQNEGYGHGVWTGLQSCTAEWLAWSHSDQQCDPCDAFRGWKIVSVRPDEKLLVKGRRRGRAFREIFVSRVFEILARVLLRQALHEVNAQPKVFSRALLAELLSPPKDFAFDLYVLFSALERGWRIETIDVDFPPRAHGFSSWANGLASRRRTIMAMIRYMIELRRERARKASPA